MNRHIAQVWGTGNAPELIGSDIRVGSIQGFHPVFILFRADTMRALVNHEAEFFFFFQSVDKVDNGFTTGTLNNMGCECACHTFGTQQAIGTGFGTEWD